MDSKERFTVSSEFSVDDPSNITFVNDKLSQDLSDDASVISEVLNILSEKEIVSIIYGSVSKLQYVGDFLNKGQDVGEQTDLTYLGEENYFEEETREDMKVIIDEFPVPSPDNSVVVVEDEDLGEEEDLSEEEDLGEDEDNVKVKVRFTTDGNETMIMMFNNNSTIKNIKNRLAKVFRVKKEDFRVISEDEECSDKSRLSDYFINPDSGMFEFGLQSVELTRILAPGEFSRYIPFVETKQFRIPREVGGVKIVEIIVENQCFVKEWLGGYRNRVTNQEYHHAKTQTLPRKRPPGSLDQFTRQTQTPCFPFKELSIDTTKHKTTQMWRTDHYVANIYDKIVSTDPERFISVKSNSRFEELVAVIVLVKRYCHNFKKRAAEKKEKELEEKELKSNEAHKKQLENILLEANRVLIIGGTYPITRDDFYLLYLTLGKWWKKEVEKILKLNSGSARKSAFYSLLMKETEVLRGIEGQREAARKEVFLKKEMNFLATCARPIIFRNREGVMSSIDTVETQQAREYQEIVSSYLNTDGTKNERIDKLQTLILQINSYNAFEHSKDVINLLNRECTLLSMGINIDKLKTLRDRVLQLIQFNLHCPTVNPSCINYQKPSMPKLYKNWHRCKHCGKLKPACDYNVHVKLTKFECCYSCEWMKNISLDRLDLTPYIRILNHVRQTEIKYCCRSANCYVLRPVGMRYLTLTIWGSKSIISDSRNLNDIRFFRFYRDKDWAPWNCILLTLDEGKVHLSLDNVDKFYSESLLRRIHWLHIRARLHFVPLVLNDRYLSESKLWDHCQDTGKFLHPAHINQFAKNEDFEHFG